MPLLRLFLLALLVAAMSGCNIKIYTSGQGTVTAVAPTCHVAPDCFQADRGSTITLTAVPATAWRFVAWGGACAGQTSSNCALKVGGDAKVQAVFEQDPYSPDVYNREPLVKPAMQPGSPLFFQAPWPNDLYSRNADGTVSTAGLPLPSSGLLIPQIKAMAARTQGFSTRSAAYFQINVAKNIWEDFLRYYNKAPFQGAYINIDNRSASFGTVIPAVVSFHAPSDRRPHEMPLEQTHLLMLQPASGYTMEPDTQYSALLMTESSISDFALQSADLLARLAAPWDASTGMSRAVFDGLRDQQQRLGRALAMTGKSPADIAAFTAFTTGHPKAVDQAVGKAFAGVSDADILAISSVSPVTDASHCATTGVEIATVQTKGPDFVTGSGLHLFGGGNIVIENGVAAIQAQQDLTLKVYFPCRLQGVDEKRALIAHAPSTGSSNGYSVLYARDAVSVVLTAPETAERLSDSSLQLEKLATLLGFGGVIDTDLLVDFNLFNMNAAISQHVQYGADLHMPCGSGACCQPCSSRQGWIPRV